MFFCRTWRFFNSRNVRRITKLDKEIISFLFLGIMACAPTIRQHFTLWAKGKSPQQFAVPKTLKRTPAAQSSTWRRRQGSFADVDQSRLTSWHWPCPWRRGEAAWRQSRCWAAPSCSATPCFLPPWHPSSPRAGLPSQRLQFTETEEKMHYPSAFRRSKPLKWQQENRILQLISAPQTKK